MRTVVGVLCVLMVLLTVAYGALWYRFYQFERNINNERWRDKVTQIQIDSLKRSIPEPEIPEFKLEYPAR